MDNYTKSMLTIIAVCLIYICLKDARLIPAAEASDVEALLNPAKNYGLVPLNADGSIDVKLVGADEIEVEITGINTRDKLNVNVENMVEVDLEKVNGMDVQYSAIPVKIQN